MLLKNKFKMTNITIPDMKVEAQKNLQRDRLQKKETLEKKLKLVENKKVSSIIREIGNYLADDLQRSELMEWTEREYSNLLRLTEIYGAKDEIKITESFSLIGKIENYLDSQTIIPELTDGAVRMLVRTRELRQVYFK